jgi:Uma2 family endonuclease
MIVEILSISTRSKDMYTKLSKYKNAGVREYWMVDPLKKKVIVYHFENGDEIALYGFDAKIPVGISGGELVIDFAEIYDEIRYLYD